MNKKGAALIIAYLIIAVLTVLTVALMTSSITEGNLNKRYNNSMRAFWLAEAGAQRAIWELNYGAGAWTDWSLDAATGDRILSSQSLTGITGEYDVRVTNPSGASHEVTANGYFPNQASGQFVRSVQIQVTRDSDFLYGAFGDQSFTMSGNARIDSYNSSQGYIHSMGFNGDIGTNGTSSGAITLSGNSRVRGDAGTGPDGTIESSGNAQITGSQTHNNNVALSSTTVLPELSSLSSGGSLSVSGNNTRTLAPGNYKFSSISISGNGRINLTGEVNIYLTGSSSLSITGNGRFVTPVSGQVAIYADGNATISGNGMVNQSQIPGNLLLYGTGTPSSRTIQVSGNGNLHGAVYAPDADITITGNGSLYGSLIGKTINMSGNAQLHYDEALQNLGGGNSGYNIESWQEI